MQHDFRYDLVDLARKAFAADGFWSQPLLAMDPPIPRASIAYSVLKGGAKRTPPAESRRQHVLFFLKGAGAVENGGQRFAIRDRGTFASLPDLPFTVTASDPELHYLDIALALSAADLEELALWRGKYPFFLEYYESELYSERAKTPKTKSRATLKPHIVPRFSKGSVDTTGPDQVAKHAHPFLEQYFFSFEENECTLLVDDQEFELPGNMLIYIPLGSNHGVDVKEGKRLHYLWIDFFDTTEKIGGMIEAHKMLGTKGK
jgi:mannose-6-phosphate isomerase-like protein (cupin superfamily)